MTFRRFIFWTHLFLGIVTGLVGALMAGTAVIMAFADTYLELREYGARHVAVAEGARPMSLDTLVAKVEEAHEGEIIQQIGLFQSPDLAWEFYHGKEELDYVNPYEGTLHPSDYVPLHHTLHKGVERWHRFFGFSGDASKRAQGISRWFNVALIPLLLTGLILWWPKRLQWAAFRGAAVPAGAGRGGGTYRSWHTSLGFWTLLLLLIMVVTATTHSFQWVKDTAMRWGGTTPTQLGAHDSMWAPGLGTHPISADTERLSLDAVRKVADRELTGWTRLDLFPAPPVSDGSDVVTTRLVAKGIGSGPGFFPTTVQIHPYSGEVLDVHSWADLGDGTRMLAWSRWLHRGDAFGRTGQVVAGLACMAFLILIYTGWALALRRLLRKRRP